MLISAVAARLDCANLEHLGEWLFQAGAAGVGGECALIKKQIGAGNEPGIRMIAKSSCRNIYSRELSHVQA